MNTGVSSSCTSLSICATQYSIVVTQCHEPNPMLQWAFTTECGVLSYASQGARGHGLILLYRQVRQVSG